MHALGELSGKLGGGGESQQSRLNQHGGQLNCLTKIEKSDVYVFF